MYDDNMFISCIFIDGAVVSDWIRGTMHRYLIRNIFRHICSEKNRNEVTTI